MRLFMLEIVMPTIRLRPQDSDYAVCAAIPVEDPGLTFIYGRQSCDTRCLEGGSLDVGNAGFSGQEALIVIDDVFVPWDRVFMYGETEFVAPLVERFTAYHRRSYVCKAGVGDVLIGAAATIADYNGVSHVSHVRDKLVEMGHLNETIYSAGIAASHEAFRTAAAGPLNGILAAVDEPLVSIDYKGDPHSSSVDLEFTQVLGGEGDMVKVVTWYDNEWGYSCRTADLANLMASKS